MKNNKLLIMILVSLLIIGGVTFANFLSFSNIEKIIINQLKENQRIETEHAANQIESHILQVKDELVTLSKFPAMDSLDINRCSGDMRIIHEKIEGKIDSLLRVDSNGNVVECSSPAFSDYLGMNIKNKHYFTEPKETSEPHIDVIRQGMDPQIIVSTPLFETTEYTPYPNFVGEFNGVLMSIVELSNLYNLYLHPVLDSERNLFLLIDINTEDTLVKTSNLHDYSEIKDYLPAKDIDTVTDFNDLGETIITSSDVILGSESWKLIIFTPLSNVGNEIKSVQRRHMFSLGLVTVVIIVVFFFIIFLYKSKEEVQSKLEKTNVTLEKLGIKIEVEKDKYNQSDISLDPKKIYLVKEDDENHAYELFINSLNKGYAGLGIVRDDPRDVKKKYNLHKTSFIWLTKSQIEDIACETNIDNLFGLISEFVKKSEKSIILLDRLDYILTENKLENVIKKIHSLKDLISAHNSIAILSINPELVEGSQLKAIETETIDLYGKHLRNKVELSDIEMDILQYINERNVVSKLASYKDITGNFRITKPTTRAKIAKLQNLGLLTVEQKGRFKSLKITSAGRRIIG